MARKRCIELVVGISKDTPLVFVRLALVIGKGQYIPERDLPVFSIAPGQVSLASRASLVNRSSPLERNAKQTVAKKRTALFISFYF